MRLYALLVLPLFAVAARAATVPDNTQVDQGSLQKPQEVAQIDTLAITRANSEEPSSDAAPTRSQTFITTFQNDVQNGSAEITNSISNIVIGEQDLNTDPEAIAEALAPPQAASAEFLAPSQAASAEVAAPPQAASGEIAARPQAASAEAGSPSQPAGAQADNPSGGSTSNSESSYDTGFGIGGENGPFGSVTGTSGAAAATATGGAGAGGAGSVLAAAMQFSSIVQQLTQIAQYFQQYANNNQGRR